MLIFCFFGLVLAGSGSVMGIDPPEFVVEDEGEYIFSVAWQAYPSASDRWIDGYLIVNGTSVDSFHGLVQKYNEESVDTFPPYVYSRNVWLNLKPGDIVWIHSEQTDQLANTQISVQKSTSDKSQQITTVSQPQDCVRAPSIMNQTITSFPVADDEVAVLSDHFTAVESGRYSFTWQLYGTFSSSGFWVRAQVLINGQWPVCTTLPMRRHRRGRVGGGRGRVGADAPVLVDVDGVALQQGLSLDVIVRHHGTLSALSLVSLPHTFLPGLTQASLSVSLQNFKNLKRLSFISNYSLR